MFFTLLAWFLDALVETLTPRRSRRAISPRTRLRAVRLAKEQGVVLTAMQFAVATRMLRGWMKSAARGNRQMKKGLWPRFWSV